VLCGPDEHPADVAVCHPDATQPPDPAWAEDVDRVREALQAVAQGEDERSRQLLQALPRKSPLSPWRLLIAGLSDWYRGEQERAAAAWDRLDPQRRPGRIAAALRAGEAFQRRSERATSLDRRAALVHALRSERPALAEAEQATRQARLEDVSADQLQWFRQWQASWSSSEPELVKAIGRNLLVIARDHPDNRMVEQLASRVPGPAHDPANCLRLMKYYELFVDGEERIAAVKQRYLQQDLPACRTLSAPVKAAVASKLHYREAREVAGELQRRRNFMRFGMGRRFAQAEQELRRQAERGFRAAIEAYPAHRQAHQDRLRLLEQGPLSDPSTKAAEQAQQARVAEAMEQWASSLPEDIAPRRWLVHHYLENDRLDEATPHVEMLQRQRLTDPWGRALGWRLALFGAMSLARRKRAVGQAEAKLEEASQRWPAWLGREWLPFLQAALAWRAGEDERFAALRAEAEAAVGDFPLLRQVMLYAAARRLHLPNPQVKPLRDALSRMLAKSDGLAPHDLLKTGAFLWDLERIGALYPGYRTHAGTICEALGDELAAPEGALSAESLGPAALWLAGRRFGAESGSTRVLSLLIAQVESDPLVAAAYLREHAECRHQTKPYRHELQAFRMLQQRADAIEDPFYHHYIAELLEKTKWLDEYSDEAPRRPSPSWLDDPADLEAWFEDEENPDEDDTPCDCINCRRDRGELSDKEAEAIEEVELLEEALADEEFGPHPPEVIEMVRQMAAALGMDFDPDLADKAGPASSRRRGSRPARNSQNARSSSRK